MYEFALRNTVIYRALIPSPPLLAMDQKILEHMIFTRIGALRKIIPGEGVGFFFVHLTTVYDVAREKESPVQAS